MKKIVMILVLVSLLFSCNSLYIQEYQKEADITVYNQCIGIYDIQQIIVDGIIYNNVDNTQDLTVYWRSTSDIKQGSESKLITISSDSGFNKTIKVTDGSHYQVTITD